MSFLRLDGRKEIFVFGSNEAGRHGKGAANIAVKKYGAVYGIGFGRQGNSFAIPTKDERLKVLPLEKIEEYVSLFLQYTEISPCAFKITQIGCGLAGYKPSDIASFFSSHTENCFFDEAWKDYLPPNTKFWGTH